MTTLDIQLLNRYLKCHPADVTEANEAPLNPVLGARWKVIDPVTGQLSCNRVFIPFRDYLGMVEGLDQGLVQRVPDVPVWATVWISDKATEYQLLIPDLNTTFRPEFQHLLKMLKLAFEHVNSPGYGLGYYGYGEAGGGKTSTALWLAAVLNYPVVQMNCSNSTEIDDLFIRQIPDNGKWITAEGPLIRAVRHNWWALVDELDLAPSSIPPALNDLVEGHAFSVPGYKEFSVQAGNGFRLFCFGNTGFAGAETGLYNGRNIIDTSFKSRCVVDQYSSLSEATVSAIIAAKYPDEIFSPEARVATAQFFVQANRLIKQEQVQDGFTPRNLFQFIEAWIGARDTVKEPLLYAAACALPLMEEDLAFAESVLNLLSTSFREMLGEESLGDRWERRYEPADKEGSEAAPEKDGDAA